MEENSNNTFEDGSVNYQNTDQQQGYGVSQTSFEGTASTVGDPANAPSASSYVPGQTVPNPSAPSAASSAAYNQPDAASYGAHSGADQGGYNTSYDGYNQQNPYAQPQNPYSQPQNQYAPPQNPYAQPGPYPYAQPGPYAQPIAYAPQFAYLVGTHSKLAAGLLGIFLGCLGVHNFYLGNTPKAVAQLLLTLIGWIIIVGPLVSGIWALVEAILILSSKPGSPWHRDAAGYELQD